MAAILRLQQVSKTFGALKAIDQISLDVAEGEALGVIGPNGAGKSTLFNLITGDLAVSGGQIAFLGRDVTRLPAHKRCRLGIGRSYQIPHPFVGMTVFENVLAAAAFGAGLSEAACYPLCIDILERTNLRRKVNELAGTLTVLERKRLELARALATRPKLLLLDEIAGGLTESECHELVAGIKELHATGLSIIWIEHVVHALLATVQRLLVINFGQQLADGEPRRVMADPTVVEVYMGIETA